ncbi:hypothetical protein P6144_17050 [Sphingomonas sp. HITSZ_GF]|nr:hypothetical protein [Sphingomonas sp. HITSZ_GF]MDG2535371.1 hypothetical protein [Sphingomonas sp. HITSZ_GF]
MDPIRNLPEPAVEVAPLVYYILPQEEPQIGPGDLEIEFEFDPDFDEDSE